MIDSGQVRLSRYNPRTQVQRLQIEHVSQASARQRRGRCGRVTDGICIYLYDKETFEESPPYTDPEIRRSSLAGVILQMDLLGLPPIESFPLIDPPQAALIREGYKALQDIGAIDARRKLTKLGRRIATFPVDPHLARLIVQAREEGVLPEILILVDFLSIQDVRERPSEKADAADLAHQQWVDPTSDFITILNLWNTLENERTSQSKLRKFCKANFINYRRVKEWNNLWKDLRSIPVAPPAKSTNRASASKRKGSSATENYDLIHRSLLAGLPANIGIQGEEREFTAARNRTFFIFPGSGLFKKPPEWVMVFALVETTKLYARTVAQIQPEWLEDIAPHLCKSVYKQPAWNPEKGFVYAKESILSGGLTIAQGRNIHYGPINPEAARKIFIREGLAPGDLTTHGGWLKLHHRMLDDIASMEEKIRRPGALLDHAALFDHFDRLLPPEVYSVKTLERWIRKTRARIALRMTDAIFPQTTPITPSDYPDSLTFHHEEFQLIYTFDPGEELDGIALVCPTNKLAFLPHWAPDWLVPGWLEEKVNRLLRTLPKNLRITLSPIDQTSAQFLQSIQLPDRSLLDDLSKFLQTKFKLPVDASDFDESALPEFLRMKVIETENEQIVQIHTSISDEQGLTAHRSSTELLFAKWVLSPKKVWPGDALPEFITSEDHKKTRGYPVLTSEAAGVGRRVFLSEAVAAASHRAGLTHLFRIQQANQVNYIEKRPPLPPLVQLTASAIDETFLTDFFDAAIYEALTQDGRIEIRDAATFSKRAEAARSTLYEIAEENSALLEEMLEQREKIIGDLDGLPSEYDSRHDLEMQLAFLFRPGFLQTLDLFSRYPRYLRAMQIRIQRIRNNAPVDLRKLTEIEPFQNQLNDKLLECDDIGSAHDLIEFAMLLEEFRVNRFAPEVKTPIKISARRLEEAYNTITR